MRTRNRALAGGLAVAAALGGGAAPTPASADVPSDRVTRTEVTFDRSVVAQLNRLGVRIRAVDAEQHGRGDDVRITFRTVRTSRPGVIEHRGGLLFDFDRRPDVQLSRPTVDLRQDTVSFSIGRTQVTLLSVDDGDRDRGRGDGRGDGRDGNRGGDRDRPGDRTGGQGDGRGDDRSGGNRAPGGAGVAPAIDAPDEVTLRLTREGEEILDRALHTQWFRAGQEVATAEFRGR